MDLVTPDEVIAFIARKIRAGEGAVIANHNAHSLHLVERHPEMAALYRRADLVEIDSRPLILFARLLGLPVRGRHQCTYLNWRERFWRAADREGWRVFYLGGAPGVAAEAARRLADLAPQALVAAADGFFDLGGAQDASRLEAIRLFRPQVLLVGMGMPRQELWLQRNQGALQGIVVLPVGAAFDYEAGVKPAPPPLLRRLALEWAFRLAHEPRRLSIRYLVEPFTLAPRAGGEILEAGRRLVRLRRRRRAAAPSGPDPGAPPLKDHQAR
jgi:N-acetylglucosaminyldiphosphoundecaprenol N-acetyl-beta-D-mannosaminyltransferase